MGLRSVKTCEIACRCYKVLDAEDEDKRFLKCRKNDILHIPGKH